MIFVFGNGLSMAFDRLLGTPLLRSAWLPRSATPTRDAQGPCRARDA